MKKIALILAIFSLAGCATEGKFRDQMGTWVGHPVDEFIVRNGPPQSESRLSNGSRLLQWTRSRGSMAYASYNVAYAQPVFCTTRFVVNEANIIQGYSYEGNACKAK